MNFLYNLYHNILFAQEQLAGFSRGNADILRRRMGAKKAKELKTIFPRFIKGCKGRGIGQKKAEELWENMLEFAGYAFNKAHSAGYAILAYRMAYLKGHYHDDFMNAVNIDLKRRGIA